MKKLFLGTLICLISFACQNNELVNPELSGTNICGVTDPLKDLPWLKARIEESSTPSDYCTVWKVIQGDYAGKTVYIVVLSGALCCTCGNGVVDCEGNLVFSCNAEEEARIKNKKVIWEKK